MRAGYEGLSRRYLVDPYKVVCLTLRATFYSVIQHMPKAVAQRALLPRRYALLEVNWPASATSATSATKGRNYTNRLREVLRNWWENCERVMRTAMPLLMDDLCSRARK